MFGRSKAKSAHKGEISIDGMDMLDNSFEFARLWSEPEGEMTALIVPQHLGADPALFGMAAVDAIRHAARAWAAAVQISEEEALERIYEGFDAERANNTTGLETRQENGPAN